MTEPTAEPTPEPAAQPEPEDTTDWKAEARKWETRAKDNNAARLELEKAQRASMTEAEKAVAEAEERGRTSARTEYGQRLVKSDFTAAAARRNSGYDATAILDDLNLARYIGEDGEPDQKAIEQAVTRLIPEGTGAGAVPMDLGVKQTATAPQGMTTLIRKAAGRA